MVDIWYLDFDIKAGIEHLKEAKPIVNSANIYPERVTKPW